MNGNGAITLKDIGRENYAKTSFGSVLAERNNGNLKAENRNGSVIGRNVLGDAVASTSFGSVTLESVGGKLFVENQNCAISVSVLTSVRTCHEISLKTSFAPIRAGIPEGQDYSVSARTSFGRISSEQPITSTRVMESEVLEGRIGDGNCPLRLTDSNGNIEIAKAK
jgi:hypothetical protein